MPEDPRVLDFVSARAFLRNRLQVFVSSTFSDLITERQAAVEAILTAGHIPAGMELFTSGDESQMAVIKQWIDESDVYLLILGGRYGSVEPTTGLSYTQLEYQYALDKEKSIFACVLQEDALEARVKKLGSSILETDHPKMFRDFRTLVLTKLVRFWEDSKDIKIAIGETLSQFARRGDLVGWVRADQEANTPALADEIARLSKENADLRGRLAEFELDQEPLEIRDNRHLIETMRRTMLPATLKQDGTENHEVPLLDLFRHAGPSYAAIETSTNPIRDAVAKYLGVDREEINSFDRNDALKRLFALGLFDTLPNPKFRKLSDKGRELLRGLILLESGSVDE